MGGARCKQMVEALWREVININLDLRKTREKRQRGTAKFPFLFSWHSAPSSCGGFRSRNHESFLGMCCELRTVLFGYQASGRLGPLRNWVEYWLKGAQDAPVHQRWPRRGWRLSCARHTLDFRGKMTTQAKNSAVPSAVSCECLTGTQAAKAAEADGRKDYNSQSRTVDPLAVDSLNLRLEVSTTSMA